MLHLLHIKIALILIAFRIVQTKPIIQFETLLVNGVFSVYFPNIGDNIEYVTYEINFLAATNLAYNIKVDISAPIDGYWIYGTETEYAAGIYNFDAVEINVVVHNRDGQEHKYNYEKCWKGISISTCSATEISTSHGTAYYCPREYVFSDEFDRLDLTKWEIAARHLLYSKNEEFVLYNNSADNVFIKDDRLHIRPTIVQGDLTSGKIDFGAKCTSNLRPECELNTDASYKVLPPVSSALLRSHKYFSLLNMRVDINAKLPKGDWIVPHLWLQNCDDGTCSGIRIAFARGNVGELKHKDNNTDVSGRLLAAGPVNYNTAECCSYFETLQNPREEHFGDNFHVYSFAANSSHIQLMVDADPFGNIKIDDLDTDLKTYINNNFSSPKYKIVIGVSVGGHRDFACISSKPWMDTDPKAAMNFSKDRNWRDTWRGEEALIVDYVQVYNI